MRLCCSEELTRILSYAREEALRTGHRAMGADHVVLGILRHAGNKACILLKALNIDTSEFKLELDRLLFRDTPLQYHDSVVPHISTERMVSLAGYEALRCGTDCVSAIHLLLAAARDSSCFTSCLLYSKGVDYDILRFEAESRDLLRPESREMPQIGRDEIEKTFGAVSDRLLSLYSTEGSNVRYLS